MLRAAPAVFADWLPSLILVALPLPANRLRTADVDAVFTIYAHV